MVGSRVVYADGKIRLGRVEPATPCGRVKFWLVVAGKVEGKFHCLRRALVALRQVKQRGS